MADQKTLAPLLAALRDWGAWLARARVKGVVIGGVAASLIGRPRVTRDVDAIVIVPDADWAKFVAVGARFGFTPRRADALDFAARTRVLLMRHEPSAIDLDLSFALLPFEEETVARAIPTAIAGLRVPVATAEDLIVMKAVAGRPRDVVDIEGLLEVSPKLDLARIREHTRAFATAMEMPEIVERLEGIIGSIERPEARRRARKETPARGRQKAIRAPRKAPRS